MTKKKILVKLELRLFITEVYLFRADKVIKVDNAMITPEKRSFVNFCYADFEQVSISHFSAINRPLILKPI